MSILTIVKVQTDQSKRKKGTRRKLVNSMAYGKNKRGGYYILLQKKGETLQKDCIQSIATKTSRRRIETEVEEREEKKRKQRITTACRKECIDPPNIMKKQGKNKQTLKHCSFRRFIHFIYTHFFSTLLSSTLSMS